jgi:hypothetical protein
MNDRTLFIRTDTHKKDQATGGVTPVSVFRGAKMKKARYSTVNTSSTTNEQHHGMPVLERTHKLKYFFACSLMTTEFDGMTAPLPDSHFHIVFEVHTDGSPHPQAWSRLCGIDPFLNWYQGQSMVIRIEWEHPPNSGKWRYRYLQARETHNWVSVDTPGSNICYMKTIAMIRWLFDTSYNNVQDWIPRLSYRANIIQVTYHPYSQSYNVGPQ